MGAEFQVADADRSVAFYHDVLGIEYPPGWIGKISQPTDRKNGPLTGAVGGKWRIVALVIPGAAWHIQIVETTGLDRKSLDARRRDVGAAGVILYVSDIDAAVAALKKAGAHILTSGKAPIETGRATRALLAQDPDGYFIELRQKNQLPIMHGASNIIDARMSLTVEDTEKTTRYWKAVLDFDFISSRIVNHTQEMPVQGTPGAVLWKAVAQLQPGGKFGTPGGNVFFEFLEFKNIER